MKEHDPLDELLKEWKSPQPAEELDQRVVSAYQSAAQQRGWQRFWKARVSVPAPVLVAAAIAIFALFFWLRSAAAPATSPGSPGIVTRLNASGFQPLPNGEARVVKVTEGPQ
jgi:hypothetical protein